MRDGRQAKDNLWGSKEGEEIETPTSRRVMNRVTTANGSNSRTFATFGVFQGHGRQVQQQLPKETPEQMMATSGHKNYPQTFAGHRGAQNSVQRPDAEQPKINRNLDADVDTSIFATHFHDYINHINQTPTNANNRHVQGRSKGPASASTPTTPSTSRRRFPDHEENLDMTQNHIFPSNLTSNMSTSFSTFNVNGMYGPNSNVSIMADGHEAKNAKISGEAKNISEGINSSFRRVNILTGVDESTNYDAKKQKMIEYQKMLDEQRKEKEARVKEEKEKIKAQEEAIERR